MEAEERRYEVLAGEVGNQNPWCLGPGEIEANLSFGCFWSLQTGGSSLLHFG
jgi:hypothetical protein